MQSHFLNMTACCQLLTDILESRKDVVHLSNPYQKCPVYETSSFLLRLVQLDDAKDLLACYSDRRAVANMNADCCTSDFYYETLTQMQECIRFWLREYQQQAYIRFAIIDKTVKKAVGTAEIFGGTLGGGLSGFGVLRIDLALPYETAPYSMKLFHSQPIAGCRTLQFLFFIQKPGTRRHGYLFWKNTD